VKPIQVAILVSVAALGGGLFTKWLTTRNATVTASESAPMTPPVQAAMPIEASRSAASSDPEPAPAISRENAPAISPGKKDAPSPFVDKKPVYVYVKPPKSEEKERIPRPRPTPEPEMVAQNQPVANPAAQGYPESRPQAVVPPRPAEVTQPEPLPAAPLPPPQPARQVTLRAGTVISARIVEALSTNRNLAGDTFTATLDQPLVVDGLVIAERGAHLEGKVVQSERASRTNASSNLVIALTQLNTSDGQRVPIETETFETRGKASGGESAAKVGGGAALGAIIGAISGGGKGAGIGAAVGGAAGAGGAVMTRSKNVALAPETRVSFRLRNTITVTERQNGQA